MNGHCAPRFAPLRDLLERRLGEGEERGASICVVQDGETVVDIWGGDAREGVPWERDTLVNTFSVTKTMLALVVLGLADAGELDLDAPVARYWPEFAAEGKAEVLVRHVLGHTSGLPGWDEKMTVADLYDTRRAAALLAAQKPWFEPGNGSGYQAISHGHLLGELVQRVTGRSAGTVLRTDYAEPLGADYWLGAPESADERVAVLKSPPHAPDLGEFGQRALLNPLFSMKLTTTREFLGAELGGFNGQGNARSVAGLARGHPRRQDLPVAGDRGADLRGPIRFPGPGSRSPHPLRHGVRAAHAGSHAHAVRADLLVGRPRRRRGGQRPRPADDHGLHDEQDGRRARRGGQDPRVRAHDLRVRRGLRT
jgi:CubicO group peptidase (beta-lactamase class C family)